MRFLSINASGWVILCGLVLLTTNSHAETVDDLAARLMPDLSKLQAGTQERTRSFKTRGISTIEPDKAGQPVTSGVVPKPIAFERDSAVLTPEGMKQLDELAAAAGKVKKLVTRSVPNAVTRFSIAGHASKEGDAAHNRELSERRARAVEAYFERYFDFKASEFTEVVGYGADRPLPGSDGFSPENRRVEIQTIVTRQ